MKRGYYMGSKITLASQNVDVLNNSDEKHTKRDCPMMQVLFTI